MAQTVKRLPAMQETRVQFLGREDPLEKKMAVHSSTLAWKIPWTEGPDRLQSMRSQRVGHDWATSLSLAQSSTSLRVCKSNIFWKGRGTRDQIANISWIIEKARQFQKNLYFIAYAKAFDCVDHNKVWKILKEMGIPDPLICLLRNLYAGQEATVRTGHGTTSSK